MNLPAWASGALKGAAAGAAHRSGRGTLWSDHRCRRPRRPGAYGGATAPAAGPAPSPAPSAAPGKGAAAPAAQPSGDGSSRAKAILALQQFAAAVPVLVQLVAASGGKESGPGDNGSRKSFLERLGAGIVPGHLDPAMTAETARTLADALAERLGVEPEHMEATLTQDPLTAALALSMMQPAAAEESTDTAAIVRFVASLVGACPLCLGEHPGCSTAGGTARRGPARRTRPRW